MSMIRNAIIVDDERSAIDYLLSMIEETTPDLHVVGTAQSSEEALILYKKWTPDLIFMDIELDERNGLEVISEIYETGDQPCVVFITAHDKHAIDAFKQNALHYLLKPVLKEDLAKAIGRFMEQKTKDQYHEGVLSLLESKRRIRFNTREGFILLNPEEILYCEANKNYTEIFLNPSKHTTISLNLGKVGETLPGSSFWRISKSHIINSAYLYKVDRLKRRCLIRKDGEEVSLKLSLARLKEFPLKH